MSAERSVGIVIEASCSLEKGMRWLPQRRRGWASCEDLSAPSASRNHQRGSQTEESALTAEP